MKRGDDEAESVLVFFKKGIRLLLGAFLSLLHSEADPNLVTISTCEFTVP